MLIRLLKKDLKRNRAAMAVLFACITLAALLISGAAGIVTELAGSMASLFEKAAAPHYVQMTSEPVDPAEVEAFAGSTPLVDQQQTAVLLNLDGSSIFLGNGQEPESGSVLENSFVKQNREFDFLLDGNNQVLEVGPGEIGVPVYYMKQRNLQAGDPVTIVDGDLRMEFTIKDFVRDAQMNPSLVTSKRFLISDEDWEILEKHGTEQEYLIEFRLKDRSSTGDFERLYQSGSLPQTGTAVTYNLYLLLNAMSDGMTAAVIILISLLLSAVSAAALRFILISAVEEDYGEIGVMKAMGIGNRQIKRLYMIKYLAIAGAAAIAGYVLSMIFRDAFTENITLYMGRAEQSLLGLILPGAGAALVFLSTACFCSLVLGCFRRIGAAEALRNGASQDLRGCARGFRLYQSRRIGVNLFLGINETAGKLRIYGPLCFVYAVCIFLMVVPVSFLSTVQSPDFITYMGAGRCDLRIDLHRGQDGWEQFQNAEDLIRSDPDVERYAVLQAGSFKTRGQDGELEYLKVESGDFTRFPLKYVSGRAPLNDREIALSVMNAEELGRGVGDGLSVLSGSEERQLSVTGIYQDVTNGGKTAKAMLPLGEENGLWYTISLDLKPGVDAAAKKAWYASELAYAKVTDMDDYVGQTLGSVIGRLRTAAWTAVVLAAAVAALITALFFKMLTAKERPQNAVMGSIGFKAADIRSQYRVRALLVLTAGTAIGLAAAETLGPSMAGALLSGVSGLRFIVNPLIPWAACPLLLALSVLAAESVGTGAAGKVRWEDWRE